MVRRFGRFGVFGRLYGGGQIGEDWMKAFLEAHACDLSEAQIDSEARVIKNVVLIRPGESKNKREYPEAVLQQAAPVFEGVKAYADHPTAQDLKQRRERSIREITGWYSNVRYEEGALRADRHFTRTQAGVDALAIAEDILSGRAPASLAGLSINAVGQARSRDDGGLVVEAITAAHSVDDVTTPAAGGTYLAASSGDEILSAVLESLSFEEWFAMRPEYVKRVQNEMKTVRQDKAITEAKALADELSGSLKVEQAKAEALQAEIVAAREELMRVRRELAVNDALAKVKSLPAEWVKALREELMSSDPNEWEGIMAREKDKAQAVRAPVPVRGAGQQVQAVMETVNAAPVRKMHVLPEPDENSEDWARRMAQIGRN
jgi:hypothetical protein